MIKSSNISITHMVIKGWFW